MRRGAKPAKAKTEAKPPVARKSLKSADSRVRDLEKRLAEAQMRGRRRRSGWRRHGRCTRNRSAGVRSDPG